MATYIWKPSTINTWKRGIAFLAPDSTNKGQAPTIVGPNGQTYTGKYVNTNEGRHQWIFPSELAGMEGLKVNFGGQTSTIAQGSQSYEGADLSGWQPRDKGTLGSMSGNPYAPNINGYGVSPADLTGLFPQPTFADFNSIRGAKYKNVDPFDFAAKYGDFSRGELSKNFAQAQSFSDQTLSNELKNLQSYVPAASALKRSETALDNVFNQQQRQAQVNSALPGAMEALNAQGERAAAYAQGQLPNAIDNAGLELGIRSRAADQAYGGGFGTSSNVARKASDLMSAEQRFQIAQYGEGLTANNIQSKAALFLAPTEYSNAGSQINVNPTVSPAQLTANLLGQVTQTASIPAGQAFSSQIQQNQFDANLRQQTQQFNASGNFAESQFNAGVSNQFSLAKFGYQVGYAGAVAGAAQTDINTGLALQQQEQARQVAEENAKRARDAQTVGSVAGAAATVIGALAPLFVKPSENTTGATNGTSPDTGGGLPYGPDAYTQPGVSNNVSQPSGVTGSPGLDTQVPQPTVVNGPQINPQPVVTGSDFTGISQAIPRTALVQSFSKDTGISNEAVTQQVLSQGKTTLQGAGISPTPAPGYVPIGTSNSGQQLHASLQLLTNANPQEGTNVVQGLQQTLAPMGVLSPEDSGRIGKIAQTAGDSTLMSKLDSQQVSGDTKGFVQTMLKGVGETTSNVPATFSAQQLGQNWGSMSPAQKSMGIATLGLQNYKSTEGKTLAETPIVKPLIGRNGKLASPGLSVAEGLDLLKNGYNTYSLVKNYDQVNALQQIASGEAKNPTQLANTARAFGMEGSGVTGAAAPGVTPERLQTTGWNNSSNLGIGAIISESGKDLPRGYSVIARTQEGVVAMPTDNANTQALAQPGSLVNTPAGIAGMSTGAYGVYKSWTNQNAGNIGGAAGAGQSTIQGASGGSAMSAGLNKLSQNNPYLLGGVIANSVTQNTVTANTNFRPLIGRMGGTSQTEQNVYDATNLAKSANTIASALGSQDAKAAAPYLSAATAGENLYKVFNDPNSTDKQKAEASAAAAQAGVSVASALGSETAGEGLPYIQYAMMAYNANKVLNSDMSDKEKAKALRQTAENTGAAILSFGISAVAQYADAQFFGGKGEKFRNKVSSQNPIHTAADKLGAKVIGGITGGKSEDQSNRDTVRSRFQQVGFANNDYNVTLADGTQVNIGVDGHGGKHGVSDSSKLVEGQKGIKDLNSWDNDYTNDLDFSAGMMGNALSRLVSGGKNSAIDQLGGQLGNALLGKDGFGKEYSGDNFSRVAANARAVASQAGIKSKADAYQLANQAYAEGRINESDHTAALQAFNMMYDKNGYETGQKLMSGRWRGIEVASNGAPSISTSNPSGIDTKNFKPLMNSPDTTGRGTPLWNIKNWEELSKTNTPKAQKVAVSSGSPTNGPKVSKVPEGRAIPKTSLLSRSKDEIKNANRSRYGEAA